MQALPHIYKVTAQGGDSEKVILTSAGVPDLETAAPAEFGGPGDRWSPETMLTGAIADCFVLTFRAIARASRLEWKDLSCEVEATLDRVDKQTRFTAVAVRATLLVPAGTRIESAERVLHKAEENCLITSSMNCPVTLECSVEN